MTRQSPPELFAPERPVRSTLSQGGGRERTYARRRKITLTVLVLIIGGTLYGFFGHHTTSPSDIPTIKAEEGTYKQKPADPGGIDIPNQDVRVYDQLEGKNGAPAEVEHLLPPPEKPKDLPPPAPAPVKAEIVPAPVAAPVPVAQPAPTPVAAIPAPPPPSSPVIAKSETIIPAVPVKTVVTTVTPKPVVAVPAPVPVAVTPPTPLPTNLAAQQDESIEQVIENTKASAMSAAVITPAAIAPPTTPKITASLGTVSVQLASVADQSKAQSMMHDLQTKYASQLGSATLQTVRADLGKRGIFYRIQSQPLSDADANHICSALKQINAGCILVRK